MDASEMCRKLAWLPGAHITSEAHALAWAAQQAACDAALRAYRAKRDSLREEGAVALNVLRRAQAASEQVYLDARNLIRKGE